MYLKDLLIRPIVFSVMSAYNMLLLNFISYFKCMVSYVYTKEVSKQKVLDTMYINVFMMSLREGNIAILVSIT